MNPPPGGASAPLDERLRELTETMATMAELSELAIRKATRSFERCDPTEADEVLALDPELYALRTRSLALGVELLARYAPVAGDLRRITASLEISTDLDRIGRYAKDIAEVTKQLPRESVGELGRMSDLGKMVELTVEMVDTAIRAFVQGQSEPVRRMEEVDDAVDALHDAVFRGMVDGMADRSVAVATGALSILVNRYLERIADHAVSIGNHVVYMVTGSRPARLPLRRRRSPPPSPG